MVDKKTETVNAQDFFKNGIKGGFGCGTENAPDYKENDNVTHLKKIVDRTAAAKADAIKSTITTR